MFNQNESKVREQYRNFLQGEDSTAVIDFYGKKQPGSFLGRTKFTQ